MKETSLETTERVASALLWKEEQDMEDMEEEKSHEEQEEQEKASASRLLVIRREKVLPGIKTGMKERGKKRRSS